MFRGKPLHRKSKKKDRKEDQEGFVKSIRCEKHERTINYWNFFYCLKCGSNCCPLCSKEDKLCDKCREKNED